MRRWLVLILLALILIMPAAAAAQAEITIERMEVDLWPEYDRPDVLVIYHIFLPATTVFPAELSLRIPAAAGDPYNVAVRDTDGNLYVVDYTRQVEGEWARVTFTSERPEIQFEYYDPGLERTSGARSYVYRWPGDYAVTNLFIQVQQPVGAGEMQISPPLGAGLAGTDGMVYYSSMEGTIPDGTPFEVSIQYQKADDSLSVQTLRVEPSGPISAQTAGRTNFSQYLPWVAGALGLILLGGGGLWFYQSRRQGQISPARRRHSAPARPDTAQSDGDVYCHQCGRRAAAGDRFCRACGAELRQ